MSLKDIEKSSDGTVKFIFSDGYHCVLIPGVNGKNTLCLSSQIGCAMGCKFCLTGKMGFVRNLSSFEIIEQFEEALKFLCDGNNIDVSELSDWKNSCGVMYASELITSVVFMGMGEPLNNYENVMGSIEGLHLKFCYPFKKFTVSTSGVLPSMKKFAELNWKVHLALSFHSPFDDVRSSLMPFVSKWSVSELVEVCNEYSNKFRDKIMIEYLMIDGLTDRDCDLEELINLGFVSMTNFNLIALNGSMKLDGVEYLASSSERMDLFHGKLRAAGFKCFVRKNMGLDIEAACGMLK